MKRLAVTVAASAAAVSLTLTACSPSEPPPEPTPTPTATPTPTPEPEPTPEGCDPAPFTGLENPGADPHALVAVKVENSSRARPQTALENTDVVFVEMVEGGATRFVALYNSEIPDVVGPVRSLRSTDAAVLGQWGGETHLFYSGGLPRFEAQVRDAGVELHVDGTGAFFRDTSRARPHNLYARLAETVAEFEQPEECLEGLFEYDDEALSGTPVEQISAAYPSVTSQWTWNQSTGLWERGDDGVPNTSALTEDVLTATNVVVLRVTTFDTGERDASGAPVPETVLEGSGELLLFVDGQQVEGEWSKGGVNEPFEFTDGDGDALTLLPGNTWVELLPAQGALTVS